MNEKKPPYGKSKDDFFVVGSAAGLTAVGYWLEKRTYNDYKEKKDRNGKDLIGLSYIDGSNRTQAGLICILEAGFLDEVRSKVENNMQFCDIETGEN